MHDMTIRRRVIHWIRHNFYFFIAGLACIIWFLFRTGTKPSRIEYPCQQAAIAGANLWLAVFLSPLVSIVRSKRNGRVQIKRYFGAGIILAILIFGAFFFFGAGPDPFNDDTLQSNVTSDIFVVNGTSGNDGGVLNLLNLIEPHGVY